ncbi:uncharacterized protein AKAME5_002209500, partial [Lates japonicus]
AGGQTHVLFSGPAAYLMGLKSGEWFKFDQKMAPYPADLRAGFYHMYCYCDVVSQQLVGDVYAPLLRTIDIQGTPLVKKGFAIAKPHLKAAASNIASDVFSHAMRRVSNDPKQEGSG